MAAHVALLADADAASLRGAILRAGRFVFMARWLAYFALAVLLVGAAQRCALINLNALIGFLIQNVAITTETSVGTIQGALNWIWIRAGFDTSCRLTGDELT